MVLFPSVSGEPTANGAAAPGVEDGTEPAQNPIQSVQESHRDDGHGEKDDCGFGHATPPVALAIAANPAFIAAVASF